jgi:hypothetical protein
MKSTKKSSKAKVASKPARSAAKAKKPAATKAKPAKAAAARTPRSAPAATAGKAASSPPPAKPKPVHEWAEAIKKAALQNKQGHNAWPGAGSPSWKGKQRPE